MRNNNMEKQDYKIKFNAIENYSKDADSNNV